MKINRCLLLVALFVTLLLVIPARAQITATAAQSRIESLSTLPESDVVLNVNVARIMNEAMPRLMPEKDLSDLRSGMDFIKNFTTIDLRNVELAMVALRFNKLSSGITLPIPDAMFITRGDFDAKAVIGLATKMLEGKLREEKFGDHNLYLYKVSDISKDANLALFGAAFSEIAITSLDASTLAVGNTNYIKAALDAADGRGRIKPEMIASLMREPTSLISATGSPLVALAKSLGLRMAESRDPNCMTRFGEFYMSLAMADDVFRINGAMNADNPETARLLKNMISGLMQQGKSSLSDKQAQSIVDDVKLSVEGDEIMIASSITQEMATRFIREMLAPKPPAKTAEPDKMKETPPKAKSKRSARRA